MSARTLARQLRRAGYRSHSAYLRSEHWRQFRLAWWRAHPGALCAGCGSPGPLALHHRTYSRLGAERFEDVDPLCHRCHRLAHDLITLGRCRTRDAAAAVRHLQQKGRAPLSTRPAAFTTLSTEQIEKEVRSP
jgi:hypothetical protein